MSISDMAIAAGMLWLALIALAGILTIFDTVEDWWKGKNKGSK